jgi:hypothetical protein
MPLTPRQRRLGRIAAHLACGAAADGTTGTGTAPPAVQVVQIESEQGLGLRSLVAPPSFAPTMVGEAVEFFALWW